MPKIPSRRLGNVIPIGGIIAIGFLGSVIVTPLYPLYEKEYGFSPFVLTLVYATYAIGNLLALLVFGRLSDQLGRRRVALPTLGVAALAGVLFLFASGTAWLFAGRLVTGLAVGILSSTGTAWLAEQYGPDRRTTATIVSATSNLCGIALGPLLGGLLAEYAPFPLRTPLVVYLVLVAVLAVAVLRTTDARSAEVSRFRELSFRPRVGLPPDRVAAFVAPAVTALATFALGGLYFALVPSIVLRDLRIDNVAVGGAVVFELGLFAAVFVVLGRRFRPLTAMTTGLVLMLAAVALVAVAQGTRSLPLLLVAAAVGGITMAFGYRGSLEVVNRIATDEQRGQLTSSYLVAAFIGNSIPVIGVGIVSTLADPLTATITFAAVLAGLAVVALIASRVVRAPEASASMNP